MKRFAHIILALTFIMPLVSVQAAEAPAPGAEDRLMIVNGNSGRVIYDDGRNDLFCVTRRHIVAYDEDGRPIHRRTMRCR